MTTVRTIVCLVSVVAATAGFLHVVNCPANDSRIAETQQGAQPIEKDMHEFMEYFFEPTYKRLKASLAGQPADQQAWKSIKSDALILAEGGNLLLLRPSEKDAAVWEKHALEVRTLGGELYQASRKRDYGSAISKYSALLENCNRCHKQFADGKHQLTP